MIRNNIERENIEDINKKEGIPKYGRKRAILQITILKKKILTV